MESSGKISYVFRKYSIVRVLCVIFIIGLVLLSIYLVNTKTRKIPQIDSIVPAVGAPGDVVVISGKNFGSSKDMSYVEIAGSKLTATSFISWSDSCIKLVLPANVQDGLVFVGVKNQKSNAALFANEVDIPVPVKTVVQTTKPEIASISAEQLNVGDLLTISGSKFGEAKNQSKVLFTIDYNNVIANSDYVNISMYTQNMICVPDENFEEWTDSQIKLRVPDGATTGVIVIDTGKEQSEPVNFKVLKNAGKKEFIAKKIYLIQYTADISDVTTTDVSTITLRCPVPVEVPSQPTVEFTEVSPSPILQNYQGCMIHQITKNRNNLPKSVFKQTFVLPVYEINTTINKDKLGDYKKMNQELYAKYTAPDSLIPSNDKSIKDLCAKICGKEKNPYLCAKLIYKFLLDNYDLLEKNRKNDANPLDLLVEKKGDAYDFAVVYTAMLRAAEIPAVIDGGILINQELGTQAHWWCEFYLQNFGWVPVDLALGAGMEYKKWVEVEETDEREYYFGNLDSHHVIFSRGVNEMKPFSQENQIVMYPKSFALQNIWEEASNNTSKYSSYWSLPVVKGIY